MKKIFFTVIFIYLTSYIFSQNGKIIGSITSDEQAVRMIKIYLKELNKTFYTDSLGYFKIENLNRGNYTFIIQEEEFENLEIEITLLENEIKNITIPLIKRIQNIEEIIVTGTLKEVSRMDCTVPVEIFTPTFFKKNPTSTIFDALQNINGVRPQLNCNICNTGDIHINGLEGPYTMVLIDGMPIVSSLSTVYGLSGIPNSLIERIEIVKGPSSSLFGSEAVGGIINIITKKTEKSPLLAVDIFSTSYSELNTDISLKSKIRNKATVLTGINYFNFSNTVDKNKDNFTDVTLQDRISVFQKWNFNQKNNKIFTLAGRYLYEDRWGGEMNWNKNFRGSDSIYGESIYTTRYELIGNYQLPTKEKLMFSFSFNHHNQNSRYGLISYNAHQKIAFSQLIWDKSIKKHDIISGIAFRYTYYDDNTLATQKADNLNVISAPSIISLPGYFIQDEISITENQKLLIGLRTDLNSIHGIIYTPRFGYKWKINAQNNLRINTGSGFRVVNIFTEDHAALTGARIVEIKPNLKPEKSYNVNINYIKSIYTKKNQSITIDATLFYTYFNNRIIGDYETDPNKIIYDNLNGFAVSTGLSTNIDMKLLSNLKCLIGATYMDVSSYTNGLKLQQILSEKFTTTWSFSYNIPKLNFEINYTGNLYSPMRLPILSELDPRDKFSPWWSIQNIQLVYSKFKKWEIYGGIKNLLNWTPAKNTPFIIARANDPFDKKVTFDSDGKVIATPENPYALSFDPTYIYAPNQGIRGFIGVRFKIK